MTIKTRLVLNNCCYHITTRGNQKQKIFIWEEDYKKYLEKLKKYKRKYAFKLYGYCLMPNHIHLIGEIVKKEDLSKFMQGINRAYTAHFNKTYLKVGHLWQGRFKSNIITKDEYLINSINYIELNPVRANIVKTPQEYRWDSYYERNFGVPREKQMLDPLSL